MLGWNSEFPVASTLRTQRAQFKCYPDKAALLSSVQGPRHAYIDQHVGTDSQYFRLRKP